MVEIEGVVVYTSRVVIMKEHIPFCKKLSILCIGYSVVVDRVV